MKYDYILFIDEAGDTGLKTIGNSNINGSSEWFIMSGVLVKAEREKSELLEWRKILINSISPTQRKTIHFQKLNHIERKKISEAAGKLNCRLFIVASNKHNMVGYKNERAEMRCGKNNFYNFCIRLILERATDFCNEHSRENNILKPKIKLIFSRMKGMSYSQFKAYMILLSQQFKSKNMYLRKRQPLMSMLDWRLVEDIPANESPGLDVADIAASSFYNALNLDSPKHSLEYARNFDKVLFKKNSSHVQEGITLLPWNYKSLNLKPIQKSFFESYGFKFY